MRPLQTAKKVSPPNINSISEIPPIPAFTAKPNLSSNSIINSSSKSDTNIIKTNNNNDLSSSGSLNKSDTIITKPNNNNNNTNSLSSFSHNNFLAATRKNSDSSLFKGSGISVIKNSHSNNDLQSLQQQALANSASISASSTKYASCVCKFGFVSFCVHKYL